MTFPPDDIRKKETNKTPPADVDEAVREEVLPSDKRPVLVITIVAATLAALGLIFGMPMNWPWTGVALTTAAVILGVLASIMAYGDARTSMGIPAFIAVASLVALVIVSFSAAGVDEVRPADLTVDERTDQPGEPAELAAPEPE